LAKSSNDRVSPIVRQRLRRLAEELRTKGRTLTVGGRRRLRQLFMSLIEVVRCVGELDGSGVACIADGARKRSPSYHQRKQRYG
jgi:hypothetical protein